jgi:nitric oxide reductase large subunit
MSERTGATSVESLPPLSDRAVRPAPFTDRAAKHWFLSSIVWLTVVDLFGLVLATEFITPEAFGGISWLSFSRVRPSHVNGVILAWLTMMYFGALFYMLPRLVGTRGMWSERLGIFCAWAWNLMYLLGIIGLLTGHSQGREYGEFIGPSTSCCSSSGARTSSTSWPPSRSGRSGRSTSPSGSSSRARSGSRSTTRSGT